MRLKTDITLKSTILLLSFMLTSTLHAQSLKTHTDENETYTYYIDNLTNDEVIHGSYNYVSGPPSYQETASGMYVKGKKNGLWKSQFFTDRGKKETPAINGSEINTAVFNNGELNGPWIYSINLYTNYYSKNLVTGKDECRFAAAEINTLKMNFCNGIICGSFESNDNSKNVFKDLYAKVSRKHALININSNGKIQASFNGKVAGQFNNEGFMIGKWLFENGNVVVEFNNGYLIRQLVCTASSAGKFVDIDNDDELIAIRKKISNGEIRDPESEKYSIKEETYSLFSNDNYDSYLCGRFFESVDVNKYGKYKYVTIVPKPTLNSLGLNDLNSKSYDELISIRNNEGAELGNKERELFEVRLKAALQEKVQQQRVITERYEKEAKIMDRYLSLKDTFLTNGRFKIITNYKFSVNNINLKDEFALFDKQIFNFLTDLVKCGQSLDGDYSKDIIGNFYCQFNPTCKSAQSYQDINVNQLGGWEKLIQKDSLRWELIKSQFIVQYNSLSKIIQLRNKISDEIKSIETNYVTQDLKKEELRDLLNSSLGTPASYEKIQKILKKDFYNSYTLVVNELVRLSIENKSIDSALTSLLEVDKICTIMLLLSKKETKDLEKRFKKAKTIQAKRQIFSEISI